MPVSLKKLTTPFVGQSRGTNGAGSSVLRYLFGYNSNGKTQYYSSSGHATYNDPAELATVIITDAAGLPGYAFAGMTQLTQVTLDEKMSSIGRNAFSGCTGISEISLPYALTRIQTQAFQGCDNLISVKYLSAEARDFALAIAAGNESLTLVDWDYEISTCMSIPAAVTEIEEEAFTVSGAVQIMLNENTETVGSQAFANNSSLRTLFVRNKDTVLADDVLAGSNNVIVFCRTGGKTEQWCAEHGITYVACQDT